jgi:hypothetical protein
MASASTPGMGVEVLVLGRDEGLLHQVGHLVDRHEDAPLAGELGDDVAGAGVDAGQDLRLVLAELLVARQVMAVDLDETGDAAEGEDHGQRREGEKRCEQANHERQVLASAN